MAKTRVHELAKEFGIESKRVLELLKELGAFVKSASSTVELSDESLFRRHMRNHPPAGSGETVQQQPPRLSEPHLAVPTKPSPSAAIERRDVLPQGDGSVSSPPSPRVKRVPIHSLSGEHDLRTILRECKGIASSDRRLVLDFADAEGFYPSVAVPAVSVIQHFRESGSQIEVANIPSIADVMRIRNPLEATDANLVELSEPLSRLWVYFDHKQANALTRAFMDCIRRKVECQDGVLEALEWCLYEVLDNVMQHADADAGYAMIQLHVRSKRLAVCVADTGIGVQRSLSRSSQYRPRTAFDALTMAVREGVTRDKQTNQGNGLFGLVQIIEQNGGTLNLRSGRGRMELRNNRFTGDNNAEIINSDSHGTVVDFQLKVDKPVSLGNALNYEPPNLYLESLESDEGEHVISIRGQAGGAGSRIAARELKTLIMNVLNTGVSHVVLDFEGQAVVSSSFADEVIGKMFADMGFNTFNRRVKLRSMNGTVSTLVDRAIARRLAQASSRDPHGLA